MASDKERVGISTTSKEKEKNKNKKKGGKRKKGKKGVLDSPLNTKIGTWNISGFNQPLNKMK